MTIEKIAEHVGSIWSGAHLIKDELLTMEKQQHTMPAEPGSGATPIKKKISNAEVTEYVKDKRRLEAWRNQAASLVWQQCSEAVKGKVEGQPEHAVATGGERKDLIALCGLIRGVMFQFQSNKDPALSILEGKFRIMRCRQEPGVPCAEHYKMFKRHVDAAEHNGGSFGHERGLIKNELKPTTIDGLLDPDNLAPAGADEAAARLAIKEAVGKIKAAAEKSRERMLTMSFLHGSDRERHGGFLLDLLNSHTQGVNKYPRKLNTAHQQLSACVVPPAQRNNNTTRMNSGGGGHGNSTGRGPGRDVASAQGAGGTISDSNNEVTMAIVAGGNGRTFSHIACYNCNSMGHYRDQCPSNNSQQDNDVQMLMMGEAFEDFSFLNATTMSMPEGIIPWDWILLDNQSTIHCFKDPMFLRNIRRSNTSVTVSCNAGVITSNMIGDLPGLPEPVWYVPNWIANILSFDKVERHFKITYEDQVFKVHKGDGSTRDFIRSHG